MATKVTAGGFDGSSSNSNSSRCATLLSPFLFPCIVCCRPEFFLSLLGL